MLAQASSKQKAGWDDAEEVQELKDQEFNRKTEKR